MVQLLAVDTEIPLLVGCSLISGVEVLARLVVHPVFATIASSLRAWNGLSARRALILLREGEEQWCVMEIGSSNVTDLFVFRQRRQLGIKWQLS